MWRPEKDWENPYSKESDPLHMSNQEPNYTDYEAGADAILRALHKHANGRSFQLMRNDDGSINVYMEEL